MMEALSAGLPCVVSDVGELGEIIVNGVNGHLVAGRSGESFAQALLPLLSAPGALEKMAASALGSARAFSLQETARRWDEILSKS